MDDPAADDRAGEAARRHDPALGAAGQIEAALAAACRADRVGIEDRGGGGLPDMVSGTPLFVPKHAFRSAASSLAAGRTAKAASTAAAR
jgi:hypothetical protein